MLIIKTVVGISLQALLLIALLLLPAWTIYWHDALIWGAIYFVIVTTGSAYLLVKRPTSIEARLNMETKEQPREDKLATTLMFSALGIGLLACPIDVFYLQITPAFIGALKFSGLFVFVLGLLVFLGSMAANEFAEPTVHIQEERGQTVADTGLYAYVRHPMYSGFILWMIGTNLWLGTTLSLAVSILILLIALGFRIRIEEKTLLAELDGYKEYSEKVKARIIPFIF